MQCHSDHTIMSVISENPIVDTKMMHLENYTNLMFDLGQMAAILDVLPTMQCPKYFLATSLGRAYLKTL